MIRKSKITSLAELKIRQKQIRMESKIAKREFAHSMGTSRENLGHFLLKKVALPIGGGIIGISLLSRLLSSNGKQRPVVNETRVVHQYPDPKKHKKSKFGLWKTIPTLLTILRVAAPVVQAIIGAVHTHKAKEAAQTAKKAAVRK